MANERIYAVRDTTTGKLVSNITNPRRKYWDRKGNALAAINRSYRKHNLELVTFVLVEETDWLTRGIPKEQLAKEKAEALAEIGGESR